MEFSREEYWNGLPFPSPVDLPEPGIEPGSPALQTDLLPLRLLGCPTSHSVHFSSVAHLCPTLCTLWTAPQQASLSIANSWILKIRSIESDMPSNHLIPCHPLLLLPSILPNIRVFSDESALHIRWPKYWNFSFNISPSNEYQD